MPIGPILSLFFTNIMSENLKNSIDFLEKADTVIYMCLRIAMIMLFFALASINSTHAGHEIFESRGESHDAVFSRFFLTNAAQQKINYLGVSLLFYNQTRITQNPFLDNPPLAISDPAGSSPVALHQLLAI